MAPPLEDLTRVLAELGARLSGPPAVGAAASAGDALSASISSLAATLNPNGGRGGASSGTQVLDAALSLMCFDPIEVNKARVDFLVRTLVSALSASVSCRVVRPDGGAVEEMLCVGSSVSPGDCRELLRSCAALVQKLGNCDAVRHSYDLLYAVVKMAVLSPHYQCVFPLPYYKEEEESLYDMGTIAAELINHPSNHVPPSDNKIPLRLLLWHLDPSIVKHDLSVMLHEVIRRPLLCLRKELHNRMEWRIIVICLLCSPTIFMEMRTLLHFWFLATGLGSVLELHSALVSSALDILLKPISWGISIELGQKLPFSHAYFPSQHSDLLAILTGPLSCKGFLDLFSCIDTLVHLDNTRITYSSPKSSQLQPMEGLATYNSAWSMIMNFPVWFIFATALLFHREGSEDYLSETLSKETVADSISDVSLAQRAAFYLSWVLCPSNDDSCQILANNILEISHSWVRNNKKRQSYHSSIVNRRRKLRLPTTMDSDKLHVPTNTVSSMIKEFDDRCVKFFSTTAFPAVQAEKLSDSHASYHNLLHMWIPLGVLFASSSSVNEQNCDMLLRYTSTGRVLKSNEVEMKTKAHVTNDGFLSSSSGTAIRWALNGAYLIFGWLDVVEDMSSLVFDCEDRRHHFVSQLRTKIGPYLLECVKTLDEADQDIDFVIDLHNRLLNWVKSGQGCEIFGDVILKMNKKFKSPL
ncbi:hypothetical protein HU200_015237 [Digitaria exilis]|uniref:Uncharacterized protein n=1 Tax=Digitaria exilis TaxID=1010633 RepID=A0A835FA80_9POAL|nr:hypothetical protein HU200_015237 [Digitaria exilis]